MAAGEEEKEAMKSSDLERAISENDITLVLVPKDKYAENVSEIADVSAKLSERVLYVSLNKPYTTLTKNFSSKNIDTEKFRFIDCVTKSVKGVEEGGKVVCVSSPKAMTEISIAMKKVMQAEKPSITVFDSLSTLLVYGEASVVVRFSHSIISAFRSMGSKGVLIGLQDDVNSELIKDLSMFVDKVEEL